MFLCRLLDLDLWYLLPKEKVKCNTKDRPPLLLTIIAPSPYYLLICSAKQIRMKVTFNCVIVLALCLTGCAEIKYAPFKGESRGAITEIGNRLDNVDGIELYFGCPSNPYRVMGQFLAIDASPHQLAGFAKRKHAEAILLLPAQSFQGKTYSPYYADNNSFPVWGVPGYDKPIRRTVQRGFLVKFIPPEQDRLNEIEFFLQKAALHKFDGWKDFDREQHQTIYYSVDQLKKEKADLESKIATTKVQRTSEH
ncbi:MAG: hypothetical protein JWQ71_996 [Pedosphaera sp.]|nr:hypothetical protein [Pedosphaera sp.]